ncbi:hypothetical protein GS682_32290 [Nostoc sp. B(2019)]|nr:hypothetical protein [Nostoc sp. B(2019)]
MPNLIQAKRYKDSINPVHVEEFGQLIASRGARGGYFVHTGWTGNKSRDWLRRYSLIQVMSGQKLVDFRTARCPVESALALNNLKRSLIKDAMGTGIFSGINEICGVISATIKLGFHAIRSEN